MGVWISRWAEVSRADRSFSVAGVGGFSWRTVLSLVPGIWEAPSLGTSPAGGGGKGRPIMAPGVRPYNHPPEFAQTHVH